MRYINSLRSVLVLFTPINEQFTNHVSWTLKLNRTTEFYLWTDTDKFNLFLQPECIIKPILGKLCTSHPL